jgi:prepilin-type N-terminal cleavage/methylation domain-containing protein
MQRTIGAFTLIELLVVMAMVGILAASLLPILAGTKPQVQGSTCINNLSQVGIALRVWGADHNGNTPMTLASSQGGASEDVGHRTLASQQEYVNPANGAITGSRGVSMMFLCMSSELGTPKILFCPAEYETTYRQAATTFARLQRSSKSNVLFTNDLNVSYFIGVDARGTSPGLLLAGDHNLGANGDPPTVPFCAAPMVYNPSYCMSLGTNFVANLGPAFMNNQHAPQGNVGLGDGSVQSWNRSGFQNALKNSGDTIHIGTGHGVNFAIPVGVISGVGCNRIQLP